MRSPVEKMSLSYSLPKRWARQVLNETAKRFGFRLERLEDTANFIDDNSTKSPEILRQFDRIPGMISHRRGLYYYLLAYGCSVPGDIVEIGSWQGRSTAFLAQACEDTDNGVVHAIDTFKGNPGNEQAYRVGEADLSDLESNFRRNMADAGLAHRVVVHAKTSVEAAREVRAHVGVARLICIDAEHTYMAVKADLEQYADLLAPGGLFVFDDYSRSFPGVAQAIREHVTAHSRRYARPFQDSNLLVVQRHWEDARHLSGAFPH